jgi:hypothetical protein
MGVCVRYLVRPAIAVEIDYDARDSGLGWCSLKMHYSLLLVAN